VNEIVNVYITFLPVESMFMNFEFVFFRFSAFHCEYRNLKIHKYSFYATIYVFQTTFGPEIKNRISKHKKSEIVNTFKIFNPKSIDFFFKLFIYIYIQLKFITDFKCLEIIFSNYRKTKPKFRLVEILCVDHFSGVFFRLLK